jgi:hypothetical protein
VPGPIGSVSVGVILAVLAAVVMSIVHPGAASPLAPRTAVRAALGDRQIDAALARTRWDRVTTGAIDGQTERVAFFAGGRVVEEVAVNRRHQVVQVKDDASQRVPYGNWLAYQPALLVGLSAVFALMTGVAPLLRLRNLDVTAALTLLAPVILLQQRYLAASVVAAVPGLGWLMLRCCWIALVPTRSAPAATPLFHALTAGWDPTRRLGLLRISVLALVVVFVMVGVSSPAPLDVAYAVMEGATKLLHGVLPYGHLPGDVFHGDTYPLLSYVAYAPIALVAPVRSVWDSVDSALAAAVAAAAGTAALVFLAYAGPGVRRRPAASHAVQEDGLQAALAWLAFPPVLIAVSAGTTDVALTLLLVGAVVLWRRPALSSGLLCAAGWFKLAPFLLLPVFVGRLRGRGLAAAGGAVVAVSAPLLALLFALGGARAPAAMIRAVSFQLSRGSPQSLWTALGAPGLQPVAEGCVLGLVAGAAVRLGAGAAVTAGAGAEPAAGRGRLAAAAAACLIALQLAAGYWTCVYAVWLVPLLCLSVYGTAAAAAEPLARDAVPRRSGGPRSYIRLDAARR